MNDHLCTALVAASGAGAGTAFHEFGGRVWAHFVSATLLQETRSFIIATLTRGKVIRNRDEIMSQH